MVRVPGPRRPVTLQSAPPAATLPMMNREDFTKEQAAAICKVIEGHQRYLVRLRTRMEARRFPPTDRTYLIVCKEPRSLA
jgi:hypothetical protein